MSKETHKTHTSHVFGLLLALLGFSFLLAFIVEIPKSRALPQAITTSEDCSLSLCEGKQHKKTKWLTDACKEPDKKKGEQPTKNGRKGKDCKVRDVIKADGYCSGFGKICTEGYAADGKPVKDPGETLDKAQADFEEKMQKATEGQQPPPQKGDGPNPLDKTDTDGLPPNPGKDLPASWDDYNVVDPKTAGPDFGKQFRFSDFGETGTLPPPSPSDQRFSDFGESGNLPPPPGTRPQSTGFGAPSSGSGEGGQSGAGKIASGVGEAISQGVQAAGEVLQKIADNLSELDVQDLKDLLADARDYLQDLRDKLAGGEGPEGEQPTPTPKIDTNGEKPQPAAATSCYGTRACGDNPNWKDSNTDKLGKRFDPNKDKVIAVGDGSPYRYGQRLQLCTSSGQCDIGVVRDHCPGCGTRKLDVTGALARNLGGEGANRSVSVTPVTDPYSPPLASAPASPPSTAGQVTGSFDPPAYSSPGPAYDFGADPVYGPYEGFPNSDVLSYGYQGFPNSDVLSYGYEGFPNSDVLSYGYQGFPNSDVLSYGYEGFPNSDVLSYGYEGFPNSDVLSYGYEGFPNSDVLSYGYEGFPNSDVLSYGYDYPLFEENLFGVELSPPEGDVSQFDREDADRGAAMQKQADETFADTMEKVLQEWTDAKAFADDMAKVLQDWTDKAFANDMAKVLQEWTETRLAEIQAAAELVGDYIQQLAQETQKAWEEFYKLEDFKPQDSRDTKLTADIDKKIADAKKQIDASTKALQAESRSKKGELPPRNSNNKESLFVKGNRNRLEFEKERLAALEAERTRTLIEDLEAKTAEGFMPGENQKYSELQELLKDQERTLELAQREVDEQWKRDMVNLTRERNLNAESLNRAVQNGKRIVESRFGPDWRAELINNPEKYSFSDHEIMRSQRLLEDLQARSKDGRFDLATAQHIPDGATLESLRYPESESSILLREPGVIQMGEINWDALDLTESEYAENAEAWEKALESSRMAVAEEAEKERLGEQKRAGEELQRQADAKGPEYKAAQIEAARKKYEEEQKRLEQAEEGAKEVKEGADKFRTKAEESKARAEQLKKDLENAKKAEESLKESQKDLDKAAKAARNVKNADTVKAAKREMENNKNLTRNLKDLVNNPALSKDQAEQIQERINVIEANNKQIDNKLKNASEGDTRVRREITTLATRSETAIRESREIARGAIERDRSVAALESAYRVESFRAEVDASFADAANTVDMQAQAVAEAWRARALDSYLNYWRTAGDGWSEYSVVPLQDSVLDPSRYGSTGGSDHWQSDSYSATLGSRTLEDAPFDGDYRGDFRQLGDDAPQPRGIDPLPDPPVAGYVPPDTTKKLDWSEYEDLDPGGEKDFKEYTKSLAKESAPPPDPRPPLPEADPPAPPPITTPPPPAESPPPKTKPVEYPDFPEDATDVPQDVKTPPTKTPETKAPPAKAPPAQPPPGPGTGGGGGGGGGGGEQPSSGGGGGGGGLGDMLGKLIGMLKDFFKPKEEKPKPSGQPQPTPIISPSTTSVYSSPTESVTLNLPDKKTTSKAATPQKAVVILISNPRKVIPGASVRLAWSSVHTTSCDVFDAVGNVLSENLTDGTIRTLALMSTTRFGITCEVEDVDPITAYVTVTVEGTAKKSIDTKEDQETKATQKTAPAKTMPKTEIPPKKTQPAQTKQNTQALCYPTLPYLEFIKCVLR